MLSNCARFSRRRASTPPTRVLIFARASLSSRSHKPAASRLRRRSWEDFDYAPPGGETGHVAQARVVRVLDTIASRHSAGTVIVASHGNLIALALHAFMPNVDYEFWKSIPMPAVFTLIREGRGWQVEE